MLYHSGLHFLVLRVKIVCALSIFKILTFGFLVDGFIVCLFALLNEDFVFKKKEK